MGHIDTEIYEIYLAALLGGNRHKCADIVEQLIARKVPIEKIYEELFRNSLYRVGELWEYNRISVAAEHMATAVTESLMNRLYPIVLSSQPVGKKVAVACVEGELHQVGAKMVADIFEMSGWDSFFLGANTPSADLIRFIYEIRPDVLALSLSVYFHLSNLEKLLINIRKIFPDLPILVGGQAFRHGGEVIASGYSHCCYISSLDDLKSFIAFATQIEPSGNQKN